MCWDGVDHGKFLDGGALESMLTSERKAAWEGAASQLKKPMSLPSLGDHKPQTGCVQCQHQPQFWTFAHLSPGAAGEQACGGASRGCGPQQEGGGSGSPIGTKNIRLFYLLDSLIDPTLGSAADSVLGMP